jgi:hypothetical protein
MKAKVQTLKVSFIISRQVKQDGFACQEEGQRAKPLGSRMMVVNALWEPQKRVISHKGTMLQSPPFHFGDDSQSAGGAPKGVIRSCAVVHAIGDTVIIQE